MPVQQVSGFVGGFLLPLRAVVLLLRTRGLKRYAALPLVANAIVYVGIIALFVWLLAGLDVQVGPWEFWGAFGAWLAKAINWSLGPLKWIVGIPVILVFCVFTFTIVGMIVASPFNDMLSERVERAVCDPAESISLPLTLTARAMLNGLIDSTKIVLRQIAWMIATLPFLFVPLVGFLPLLLVNAYFTGLGFFDIPMARHMLRNPQKRPVVEARRAEVLGFGLCMYALFLVPFLGLLMLPLGTTAGTLLYCENDWERALADAGLDPPPAFRPPHPRGTARLDSA